MADNQAAVAEQQAGGQERVAAVLERFAALPLRIERVVVRPQLAAPPVERQPPPIPPPPAVPAPPIPQRIQSAYLKLCQSRATITCPDCGKIGTIPYIKYIHRYIHRRNWSHVQGTCEWCLNAIPNDGSRRNFQHRYNCLQRKIKSCQNHYEEIKSKYELLIADCQQRYDDNPELYRPYKSASRRELNKCNWCGLVDKYYGSKINYPHMYDCLLGFISTLKHAVPDSTT